MKFIWFVVQRAIDNDFGEPVYKIRLLNRSILSVPFIVTINGVLVNKRTDILQILNVRFNNGQHIFRGLALVSGERKLNLDLLMNLLVLEGTETVRLGSFAQLEIRVN